MTRQPRRRVAVIIDLDWAFQHHHGVFVGTQRFAQQHEGWNCDVSSHLTYRNATNSESSWKKFQDGVDDWIDTWSPPMGVYVSFDLLRRNLANLCLRRGLSIPGDVALIGSQNEPVICQQPEPTLSSIDFGYERVGYAAAELLERLMSGKPAPKSPIRIAPAALIPRQSTDVLAVDDPVIAKALRFISEQGYQSIRVPDVAENVMVTRRSLERRFQKHLGRTIAEEITRLRLERAKRLLVESDEPLKQVAADAGFGDAKQVYQVFVRLEGTSPTEYRRQRQQVH